MRVKKYLVNSIEEAEASILNDLGPTAMILSTRPLLLEGNAHGQPKIEVIAGAEKKDSDESLPAVITAGTLPTIDEFQRTLTALESAFAQNMTEGVPYGHFLNYLIGKGISPYLARTLLKSLLNRFGAPFFNDQAKVYRELRKTITGKIHTTGPILLRREAPQMIAIVGAEGSGKTTTLIKLALQYRDVLFKNVGLIAHRGQDAKTETDLRGRAVEFELPCSETFSSETLLQALDDYREQDLILIDTPGMHCDEALVQLSSIKGLQMHVVIAADSIDKETMLLIRGYKAFDPAAIIVTKLDQTTLYGNLYNISEESGIPFSYLSKGKGIPHDLEIADPGELVDLILGTQTVPA